MKIIIKLILFLVATISIIGCGGDDDSNQNRFDITGNWNGPWQGGTVNGNAVVTIEHQEGENYTGICYLDGNPCLTDCTILGHLDLETGETEILILDPNLSDEDLQTFDPRDPETYLLREHVIEMQGSFSKSGHASMTYTVIDWSYCEGAAGTFDMTN